jgi:hypothetical protein
MEPLTPDELLALVERVFQPSSGDHALSILVDLPDHAAPDHAEWRTRRQMALEWTKHLGPLLAPSHIGTRVVLYRSTKAHNADLPALAWSWPVGDDLPVSADELTATSAVPFEEIFEDSRMMMAPTEFSATAPLKVAARKFGFRAATMGGFSTAMIPALRIDYMEVNRRVDLLRGLLDRAYSAELEFELVGDDRLLHLDLDLRHRAAHASGGLFLEPGTVGNLPSGESYIVPYEGERYGDPSLSEGLLPVQFGDEIVIYEIRQNRAIAIQGNGPAAARESKMLRTEPAYANLAELGLGVIRDFGIRPCGSILLDEKLGLHVAFGRSDHFGGQVGPADFSSPSAVVHIDRVYIPEMQPGVLAKSMNLVLPDGEKVPVILNGSYALQFGSG